MYTYKQIYIIIYKEILIVINDTINENDRDYCVCVCVCAFIKILMHTCVGGIKT